MPPGLALGKKGFFLKKIKIVCRVPYVLALGKEAPLPSAKLKHSANHIFFTFNLQTFSAVLIQYLVLHVPMWHVSQTFSIFL